MTPATQTHVEPGFAVLPHENQSHFDALAQRLRDEFKPTGEHDNFVVHQMAQARWRIQRIDRLEDKAFDLILAGEGACDVSPDGRIVAALSKNGRDPFIFLQRYKAAAERSYYKANRELQHSRKTDQKFQAKAMDQYIKEVVFAPLPNAAPVNGFASHHESSARRL